MALLHLGMALLAASNGLIPSHTAGAPARRLQTVKPPQEYAVTQLEHYLSAEDISYIRPGFKIKLNGISNVGPGQSPVVDVSYTDNLDQPLDYLGKATPGPLSISFILAWYDPATRQYTCYTTRTRSGVTAPAADQAGAAGFTHLEMGHSKYTFSTKLPANTDVTKTTTLSIYGRRTLTSIIGKDYYADNINYDFRPDGGPVTATWAAMDAATTCNNCHDPISAHGGTRRTVKNCMLCHTPQIANDTTTGNAFDFKVMIHKIHRGAGLPSVVAGGKYGFSSGADFSTVGYPQDIRNCAACHDPKAAEGYIWYSRPSRKACGSCHDDINWVTGDKHVAGPQADDKACASCHVPQGDAEWDASVKNAHIIPIESAQLKGLKAQIVNVTGAVPGGKITVTFKVTNGDGSPVTPSSLGTLNILVGGPTTDYTRSFRESGKTATASGDAWVYTFTANAIPADAKGTWTVAADVYRSVTLSPAPSTGASVREAAQNPVYYVAVTDSQPVARRTAVDLVKCNKCHDLLALHGGQRFKIEECVICHNPAADDSGNRPSDQGIPESISFQRMVHRIHTGDLLAQQFTVFGNGKSKHNYNEVRFPGDRRDCVACHVAGTYTVPLPDGVISTITKKDFYTPQQPTAAACLGCHDSKAAAAHAFMSTSAFGEACEVCHSNAAEFAVDKVHAR
jgi:OmcA/MtrC family decaheme c-type cytochrome